MCVCVCVCGVQEYAIYGHNVHVQCLASESSEVQHTHLTYIYQRGETSDRSELLRAFRTHSVVGETSSELCAVLVEAQLKYPAGTFVLLH